MSVQLSGGDTYDAERVVLAVPLTLQRELRFEPPLPPHRQRALAEARYGDARKDAALFPGPAPSLSKVLTEDGFYYASTDDPRVLVRFGGAAAAAREIDFADVAGVAPRAVAGVRWSEEPWTRGTYLILGPGHLTTWGGRLGEPHGRIHFAGAEASTLPSYMEGAARAASAPPRRSSPSPADSVPARFAHHSRRRSSYRRVMTTKAATPWGRRRSSRS